MNTLLEKSRNELVTQSKRGKKELDGYTRYEKRLRSKVSSSNKTYNRIDMNNLFKNGILNVEVDVKGETDDYIVKISYNGFLDELNNELRRNNNQLDLRIIIRSLIIAFNKNDVYVKCTCPDWKFRFHYWATLKKYNEGEPQFMPTDETNPNNELGAGCKHVLLVLGNTSWVIKVASVIMNYIKYIEKSRVNIYQKIIYPTIYNKKYEEPTQTTMFDDEEKELDTSSDIIDKSNIYAKEKTQFKPGNPYQYKPKDTVKGQEEIEIEEE